MLLLVGFAEELAAIAQSMSRGTDAAAIAKQIAHAHVMFNCLGVFAALPFIPWMAKGMRRLIPDEAPEPAPAVIRG